MPNIYDVARLAKVSTTTVSKVLSNTPYVSAETRQRVLEAVNDLHYVPSLAARSLTRNKTYVLGLVIPYDPTYLFADPFLLEIIQGVEAIANDNDYNLLLSVARKSDPRSAYARLVRTGYVDGAIMLETVEGDKAVRQLQINERWMPWISIGYRQGENPVNLVHSDDYRGAFEAVLHLLGLGHRRIGVVSGPPMFMGALDERLRGVRDALQSVGLVLDEGLVVYGDFTPESGYEASAALLQAPAPPTAIFALNDRMAAGVMRRARELGLSIPGQLSLVGFDDVPLAALLDPPLTTVRQPGVELGKVATRRLFAIINNESEQFEPIVLPVELTIRASTAPPSRTHPGNLSWLPL